MRNGTEGDFNQIPEDATAEWDMIEEFSTALWKRNKKVQWTFLSLSPKFEKRKQRSSGPFYLEPKI